MASKDIFTKMSATTSKIKKPKRPVEVIVFNDPEKRKNKSTAPNKESTATNNNDKSKADAGVQRPVFDQRMAKYDIRKLAMTGMQQEDKEEAMVNYLVELGAKRPKGKAIPMKDYIEELKKRKRSGGGGASGDGMDGSDKKKKKQKREKGDIYIDGQIGKWKRGVQFISKGKP